MSTLNAPQKNFIQICFQDLHRRMAEMEAWLASSRIDSPFSEYIDDLSPAERKVIQDYFARIRTTMLSCLREAGIPLEVRRTSLRWVLQVAMNFLNVALAEMAPHRLAGYGGLDSSAATVASRIQQDIERLIDRARAYLRHGMGKDLQERLRRLEATPANRDVLILLDRIITRWQLVEFRPLVDVIVTRLESPHFEIAVFGRVSCGKSSLLNHIAGRDVLPVGVTPVTAVPTRLARGDKLSSVICFAEVEPRIISVEDLAEYASEQGNPGNEKHVTSVQVLVPSERLPEGVILVDTPGTGSLAFSGSAETLAYLPRCDLGIVLVDAASSLNQDDLLLLRSLYESAIPAQVLLSKADLVQSGERPRIIKYIRDQVRRELNLDIPVHPVSVVAAEQQLLDQWFEEELRPLMQKHRSLTEVSLQRKIASLRESVGAVLETLLTRKKGNVSAAAVSVNLAEIARLLAAGDTAVQRARKRVRDWPEDEPVLHENILRLASKALVNSAGHHVGDAGGPIASAIGKVLQERSQEALRCADELRHKLGWTIERLQSTMPGRRADPSPLLDLELRGLPSYGLPPMQIEDRVARPWLTPLFPRWAVWNARQKLSRRLGPAIRDSVIAYDRQLQSWLKGCVKELVDLYETQAEVFREQGRRLSRPEEDGAASDWRDLESDLHSLQVPQAGDAFTGEANSGRLSRQSTEASR
jgi:GTP-binding protein EngB required for normal cell division